MAGFVVQKSDRNMVRRLHVDESVLERVCDALGISGAERTQVISEALSIHIYRGVPPSPPGGGVPPSPPGGGVPPSPPSGGVPSPAASERTFHRK
jgi:hypothetical protein